MKLFRKASSRGGSLRYNGLRVCLLLLPIFLIGCSGKRTDEVIGNDIQGKVAQDRITQDSQIAVEVVEGKVILRGKAKSPEAQQRMELIARNESGVTSVEDLTVVDVPKSKPKPVVEAPAPPPPVVVPAGTVLTIRTRQMLGSKVSQTGTAFTGSVLSPVSIDGQTVIPAGAEISGSVAQAKKAGRLKGGAVLALVVHAITVNGHTYNIETELFERQSTGKGKRTAGFIGGGTGLGAVIGGIAGGGKGAAIGAVSGAAAGTVGALTGNRDISLPAESALNFRLTQPLTLQTEMPGSTGKTER